MYGSCGEGTKPVVARLPYIGRVERIVQVEVTAEPYVLLKMKLYKTLMNDQRTGMLKHTSGMCVVNAHSFMRIGRVQDEPSCW